MIPSFRVTKYSLLEKYRKKCAAGFIFSNRCVKGRLNKVLVHELKGIWISLFWMTMLTEKLFVSCHGLFFNTFLKIDWSTNSKLMPFRFISLVENHMFRLALMIQHLRIHFVKSQKWLDFYSLFSWPQVKDFSKVYRIENFKSG